MTPTTPLISVKCFYPSGNFTFENINSAMSIEEFQLLLFEKTGIEPNVQMLKTGYPRATVKLPENRSETEIATLVMNNETVIVEEIKPPTLVVENPLRQLNSDSQSSKTNEKHQTGYFPKLPSYSGESSSPISCSENQIVDLTNSHQNGVSPLSTDSIEMDEEMERALQLSLADAAPSNNTEHFELEPVWRERLEDGSYIVRRYVDSDNSCLFTAVAYVMEKNRLRGWGLREVIAATVLSAPDYYNEALLGKPNEEYCQWITNPQHWGGEIELLILSKYYKKQIAVFDIRTLSCLVYGADAGFEDRVLLLYDGIHYDALALSHHKDAPEDMDITILRPMTQEGQKAIEAAQSLVHKLQQTNQYTDLSQFQLRCDECGRGFIGREQALEHSRATGHVRFSEYR